MQLDGPPFVGRKDHLDRIADALRSGGDAEKKLVVVAGPAGVGKTALAKQAAVTAQGAGQFAYALFVDMRGHEENPTNRVDPDGVYSSVLLGVGIADRDIPSKPGDQATFYHQVMGKLAQAGKPVLLVLDNVSDRGQFDMLLPADPIHKVVLATRETFGHLPSRHVVDLDVLDPQKQSNC